MDLPDDRFCLEESSLSANNVSDLIADGVSTKTQCLLESGLCAPDLDALIGDTAVTNIQYMLQSGLSAIDVDDLTGDAVITIAGPRRQGRFPLMRLPVEIRLHVLSFLLPDEEEIYPGSDSYQEPGSRITTYIHNTYRHDGSRCEMAVMRSNRQIYNETVRHLYNRMTVVVEILDDGVNFLTTHWGCGRIYEGSFADFPFHKTKCVWLQVKALQDQQKHLVHIRRNLIDFCGAIYQLESLKCVRVDFWDPCHYQANSMWGFEEPTSVQGGVNMGTKDINYIMEQFQCTQEIAERHTWRAASSTGTLSAATDMELILQPLKLLRNVGKCQIFLNPQLQKNKSLVELVNRHKETIESQMPHTPEDLLLVRKDSEDSNCWAQIVQWGWNHNISLITGEEGLEGW